MVFLIRLLLKIALYRWYRNVKKRQYVEYRQGRNILVYKDTVNGSIPADRDGWVYLPFLAEYSLEFQPPQENDTKIYVYPVKNNDELKIVDKKMEKS